jgi:polyene glycosyltransferase
MPIFPGPVLFAGMAHAGHLNPLVAIADELSRRGVLELWFAAEEDARARVEQIPAARFVSYGETAVRVDTSVYSAITGAVRRTAGMVALARLVRGSHVERFFRHSLDQIDRIRPTLMVIDVLNIGALDAATVRGVPFILSVPFAVSGVYLRRLPWTYPTPTSGLPERMTAAQTLTSVAFRLRLQLAMVRSLDARALWRRRKAGLANVLSDPERYAAAAHAVFAYSVFGLEYPFDPPAHLHMLGAMVPDPPEPTGSELTAWLDAHPSVVYVCMGTMARLSAYQLRELADGLSGLGPDHHVLWKLPPDQRALLPAALPAHIRGQAWIPAQADVLGHPHVKAVVCHGGANIFHESVHFGQPVLVMPFWLDCYDIGARAADAGVGLTLDRPPRFSAAEVTAKVRRLVATDAFRRRSREWSGRLRRAGGVSRAADLIIQAARRDQDGTPEEFSKEGTTWTRSPHSAG